MPDAKYGQPNPFTLGPKQGETTQGGGYVDPLEIMKQLLMQSGAERKAAALQEQVAARAAMQQQIGERGAKGDWVQRVGPGGMPVFEQGDDLGRVKQQDSISGYLERGEKVPPQLYRGLSHREAAGAIGQGTGAYALNEGPSSREEAIYGNTDIRQPEVQYPVAKPDLTDEEKRIARAVEVRKLRDKSGSQVFSASPDTNYLAQMIADQLMLQRQLAGDKTAWAATFPQPEY